MITDSLTNSILDITYNDKQSLQHVISMPTTRHNEQIFLELIRKLCLQGNENEIMKKGMEFLYMNGFYGYLQPLIDKSCKSRSKSTNQRAAVYQLMIDKKLNRITPPDVLYQVNSLHSNEPEIICLIEFVKIMAHYDMCNFGDLGDFLDKQPYLFAAVDDPFLLSFFNIRMYEVLFTYYWVRNELIMARKYAFRILNLTQNPRTKAGMNINLGLTYTFDTYKQGIYHLQEAEKVSKKYGFMDIINVIHSRNIPFLSAHHRVVEEISTTDPSEQAHLEIAKGNPRKAEQILRKLHVNSPFQLYYLGLATNDRTLLHQSYNYFIEKRSDHFFSRLPILALQEMGEY